MKIIIAVDSFKECMSSEDVSRTLAEGIVQGNIIKEKIDIKRINIADGGEGTVDTLVNSTKGIKIEMTAKGPLMENIQSMYGVLGDNKTVVIDMASTCAINMVSGERKNPMNTTTYGMGMQVIDALNKGYRKFIIGLGGACTNDGGMGMFQSLGFIFKDKNGEVLKVGQGGKQLLEVSRIDDSKIDNRLVECEFTIASDVKNPLYGINGAAYVYAPQKGATPEMVKLLDNGLRNYAGVIHNKFNIDISEMPGSGAAGGIGGGLIAFLNGKMQSGIDIILNINNFEESLKNANLVITGEGKLDNQTLNGKAPCIVAKKAKEMKIPVIAVCGKKEINDNDAREIGISKIYEISDNTLPLKDNILNASNNLKATAFKIGKEIGGLAK